MASGACESARSGGIGATLSAVDTVVATLAIALRFLAMFFPTPFVGFPFVLQGTPPVADHGIRRILAAIVAVISEHAAEKFQISRRGFEPTAHRPNAWDATRASGR